MIKWELDLWYEMWDRVGSEGLDIWDELRDRVEAINGNPRSPVGSSEAADGAADLIGSGWEGG